MTTILTGDCRETLKTLPDASVHCCVTSPPYWGLRDYGCSGQIGLEQTPEAYVAELVAVFQQVWRVLRDDGTLWLNLGDSYWGGKGASGSSKARATAKERGYVQSGGTVQMNKRPQDGTHDTIKPKDLVGIPWRVAFALQADGWYLRQDIIWHKPNPMPESVTDRCTKSHEYMFLLSKSARYYYDMAAILEPATPQDRMGNAAVGYATPKHAAGASHVGTGGKRSTLNASSGDTRNKRSVWTVPTAPYSGAHFATFPPALIRPCILAGCPQGGTVLDPFGGSGTTGAVSEEEGRNSILCELNPEYVKLQKKRTEQQGLFCTPEPAPAIRQADMKIALDTARPDGV